MLKIINTKANILRDEQEVKRELITGRIYLVTGRVLATVGEKKENATC